MASLISLEQPLFPAVPVLYCVKKPAGTDDGAQLDDNEHAIVFNNVHDLYKTLRARNGTSTTKEADRERAMSLIPDSDRLVPQHISGEIGIDIMPYDKTLKYGWVWTYAAQLVYTDPDGVANGAHKGIFDNDLLDCICLMLAHRPADRISIQDLRDIATRKLNELEPEPKSPFWLANRQSRDEDKFTDGYLRGLIGVVNGGQAIYNIGTREQDQVLPYPDFDNGGGDTSKIGPLAPGTNYSRSTFSTNASDKWRSSYINRYQQSAPPQPASSSASSSAPGSTPGSASSSASQPAPNSTSSSASQPAPGPASGSAHSSFGSSGGSLSGSTSQPAPQPAPQSTSSSQQPQQASSSQAPSHH